MANLDTAEGRLALLEAVGADEYNRLLELRRRRSVLCTVNGHDIYPVHTQFGLLYAVGGTKMAFSTLDQAKAHAEVTA